MGGGGYGTILRIGFIDNLQFVEKLFLCVHQERNDNVLFMPCLFINDLFLILG